MPLSAEVIQDACSSSPWDVGNDVLYSLCRAHPMHSTDDAVIAKVWLIGRTYAAAIERRRKKTEGNDAFYVDVVAPRILASPIDRWLQHLAKATHPSVDSLADILRVHAQVTALFNDISGLGKRSLASKYLHFHFPHLFYIYDTRSVEGMRKLSHLVGRAPKTQANFDSAYWSFANKCLQVQEHVAVQYGITMRPRGLDNLLLGLHQGGR